MKLDDTICYCFHVTKRKIVNFIRIYKPRRASQIADCGGAGTGCGWCIPVLKRYFAESTEGSFTEESSLTPAEYARLRAEYIRAGRGTPPPGAASSP